MPTPPARSTPRHSRRTREATRARGNHVVASLTDASAMALRAFINSPTGPKTTHFWGPVANWGFVLAVRRRRRGRRRVFVVAMEPTRRELVLSRPLFELSFSRSRALRDSGASDKTKTIARAYMRAFVLLVCPVRRLTRVVRVVRVGSKGFGGHVQTRAHDQRSDDGRARGVFRVIHALRVARAAEELHSVCVSHGECERAGV